MKAKTLEVRETDVTGAGDLVVLALSEGLYTKLLERGAESGKTVIELLEGLAEEGLIDEDDQPLVPILLME